MYFTQLFRGREHQPNPRWLVILRARHEVTRIVSLPLSLIDSSRISPDIIERACRHLSEKLWITWPLSWNLFAPLVWGSKSREWVEANVSNSKSNQKFACQMKCKNHWKQELTLVFPRIAVNADCSVVAESQYRVMHTDKVAPKSFSTNF